MPESTRRQFVGSVFAGAVAAACPPGRLFAGEPRPRRVLLRSSWQTVNIGDIGHSPGVIQLLHDHLPDAEVTLWPGNIGNGVEDILRRAFPKLRFAMTADAVKRAFDECDFLLHGSGPSLVGQKQVAQWHEQTGKPFGVYGITLSAVDPALKSLLSAARFVFFRDSVSLQLARDHGVTAPVMEFAPDGAFACRLRSDDAATAFLKSHGLEDGTFLCCIPRLRHTPYWKIRNKPMTAEDDRKHARNEAMKEHDHAPLREAIAAVVRETALKVLVCPEDQSQMAVGKELLIDKLAEDVRRRVVWRPTYWLTDEAVSTYVRSAGLFGLEMHSPIMAIGNGVPAIVCRFAEQTSKGFMWRDIGLGDWLFDMDSERDVARIVPAVLEMAKQPEAARAKAAKSLAFVTQRQRESMAVVAKSVSAAGTDR